ncbi:MAG: TlyA family RNA methyltransferase [Chloroflexota bacterium]|nr:TlyA family RNA methyltransferase [Chloroflexota bacterium]
MRRGLAETRERAQSLILGGAVLVDQQPATRPAMPVSEQAQIELLDRGPTYVSRGAFKLAAALDHWGIDPTGKVVLDVGASTGGFTDLLLRRGARHVYALDVGHGQLHYRLRGDPRVRVMERTNVRHLASLPERPDLAVADVSFISLRLALPPVFRLGPEQVVALVKPQFEAGRGHVSKGGVVRDEQVRRQVVRDLADWSLTQPYRLVESILSPIKGPAGNIEFLSLWLPPPAIISPSAAPARDS